MFGPVDHKILVGRHTVYERVADISVACGDINCQLQFKLPCVTM